MEDQANGIWSCIADYLADDCTEEVRAVVERWIEESDSNKMLFTQLSQAWPIIQKPSALVFDADRVKLDVVARITQAAPGNAPSTAPSLQSDDTTRPQIQKRMGDGPQIYERRSGARWTWPALAMGIAVVGLFVFGWRGTTSDAARPDVAARASVFTTTNGQRASIMLPDGSKVELSVASRLEVPADYAAGNRVIRLDGEALFTVDHRRSNPFIVIAGPSTTRVLGTTFKVRHYATGLAPDTAAVVAVRDGKVSVGSDILVANEQILVTRQGASVLRLNRAGEFSFATGMLTIDDVSLGDAIPELNRWYDADIRLHDSTLQNRRVVGGFVTGSLTDLTLILERTFGVRVVREGRTLTLYPGK